MTKTETELLQRLTQTNLSRKFLKVTNWFLLLIVMLFIVNTVNTKINEPSIDKEKVCNEYFQEMLQKTL